MAPDPNLAPVFYAEDSYDKVNNFIIEQNPSQIFILVDENTHLHCLPAFLQQLSTTLNIEVIEMEAGEKNKNIETCTGVWNALSELGADRKSLMINLGGGVVTDLGGFVASTFKRGIRYINVPTSLLAMVDASVGGKTGVDLGNLKNQIGVITQPEMVLIDSGFLKTLPAAEMRSGLAEILKHGLISSNLYWEKATNLQELAAEDLDDLIKGSVSIKAKVVTQDPDEDGIRKILNFGHTFGHAIESYFLTHPSKTTLLHGEAVAIGMIIATYISTKVTGFPVEKFNVVTQKIMEFFPKKDLASQDYDPIKNLLRFDKKNSHGNINFVLLKDIGKPVIDCRVKDAIQLEAFNFYSNLKNS